VFSGFAGVDWWGKTDLVYKGWDKVKEQDVLIDPTNPSDTLMELINVCGIITTQDTGKIIGRGDMYEDLGVESLGTMVAPMTRGHVTVINEACNVLFEGGDETRIKQDRQKLVAEDYIQVFMPPMATSNVSAWKKGIHPKYEKEYRSRLRYRKFDPKTIIGLKKRVSDAKKKWFKEYIEDGKKDRKKRRELASFIGAKELDFDTKTKKLNEEGNVMEKGERDSLGKELNELGRERDKAEGDLAILQDEMSNSKKELKDQMSSLNKKMCKMIYEMKKRVIGVVKSGGEYGERVSILYNFSGVLTQGNLPT